MNAFMEIVALCALVFMFWGDPDPWDILHDKVMAMGPVRTNCAPEKPAPPEKPKPGFMF